EFVPSEDSEVEERSVRKGSRGRTRQQSKQRTRELMSLGGEEVAGDLPGRQQHAPVTVTGGRGFVQGQRGQPLFEECPVVRGGGDRVRWRERVGGGRGQVSSRQFQSERDSSQGGGQCPCVPPSGARSRSTCAPSPGVSDS